MASVRNGDYFVGSGFYLCSLQRCMWVPVFGKMLKFSWHQTQASNMVWLRHAVPVYYVVILPIHRNIKPSSPTIDWLTSYAYTPAHIPWGSTRTWQYMVARTQWYLLNIYCGTYCTSTMVYVERIWLLMYHVHIGSTRKPSILPYSVSNVYMQPFAIVRESKVTGSVRCAIYGSADHGHFSPNHNVSHSGLCGLQALAWGGRLSLGCRFLKLCSKYPFPMSVSSCNVSIIMRSVAWFIHHQAAQWQSGHWKACQLTILKPAIRPRIAECFVSLI